MSGTGSTGSPDDLGRRDVEALAATRAELGRDYESALLEGFAERVEEAIDQRVRHEIARRDQEQRLASRMGGQQLALAIVSIVACIPITLALALNSQMAALVISLLGIAAINASHAAVANRRHRII